MIWVSSAVGLASAGLVVLGFLSVRVWVAARGLGREVERTRRLLAPEQAEIREKIGASVPPEG
jgi:uncharacterized membrane protein YhiD involved in acid resistance